MPRISPGLAIGMTAAVEPERNGSSKRWMSLSVATPGVSMTGLPVRSSRRVSGAPIGCGR